MKIYNQCTGANRVDGLTAGKRFLSVDIYFYKVITVLNTLPPLIKPY